VPERPTTNGPSTKREDVPEEKLAHAQVVARLLESARATPRPTAERVEVIRRRLMAELSSKLGQNRLVHRSVDSVIALLLPSKRSSG
jgi:hypothetical protein